MLELVTYCSLTVCRVARFLLWKGEQELVTGKIVNTDGLTVLKPFSEIFKFTEFATVVFLQLELGDG